MAPEHGIFAILLRVLREAKNLEQGSSRKKHFPAGEWPATGSNAQRVRSRENEGKSLFGK